MITEELYQSLAEDLGQDQSLEDLEAVLAEKPWFALGHAALAKRYFDANHGGYADQLGRAAVYVGTPSILYDLIVAPEIIDQEAIPDVKEPAEVVEVQTDTSQQEIIEEEVVEQVQEEPEEIAAQEETSVETRESVQEADSIPTPDLGELEKDLIAEAVSDSIEKEVTPEPAPESEKDSSEDAISTEGLSGFSQWMLKRSAEVGFSSEPSAFKAEQAKPTNPADIIDRFIQSSPKITPKKAEEYSNENLAKQSLIEDESLITETMARIYAQQGKLEKARRAYRLLSLKYPEKSVYFAAQLKKLGKKSN